MSSLKLSQGDFGVQEHEHGMRAFQLFGECDQIDAPNLVGSQVILRRCQLIGFHYEKRQHSQSGKDNTPGLTRDEAAYFSGTHRLSGEVMIAPEFGRQGEPGDRPRRRGREAAQKSARGVQARAQRWANFHQKRAI